MTSGEQWAVVELEALRAAGFTPRGWVRFLDASFRRAADTRRERPELARQAHAWATIGLLSGAAACRAATRAHVAAPQPRRFVAWWLATSLMLDWHLGMVEAPQGGRRERLSVADALTLSRLWLVPMLTAQGDPGYGSARMFSTLVASAGTSDVLDGALARRVGTTRLGRDLDKLADALMLASAARTAGRAGWLPANTARLVAARAGIPVAAVAATYFRTGQRPAIDSFGATRRLAPAESAALAAAPFFPRAASILASVSSLASLASLVLDRQPACQAESRTDTCDSDAGSRGSDCAPGAGAPHRQPRCGSAPRAERASAAARASSTRNGRTSPRGFRH